MNKIFKIVIYIFAVFDMYSLGTIIYGVIVYSNALTNHSIYGQETSLLGNSSDRVKEAHQTYQDLKDSFADLAELMK